MKSTVLSICILMLFSLVSFADKVTIKGNPVLLGEQGGIYYVPDNYITSSTNNYVTIGNIKKVCYLSPQPNLNALNMTIINVSIRGEQVQWTCYDFDDNYFTVSP